MSNDQHRSGIGRQLGLDTTDRHEHLNLPIYIRMDRLGQNAAFIGICIAFVLVIYIVGSWLDQEAEQRAQSTNQRIRAAYAQGLDDAMSALKGKPEGVALMQACMALQSTFEEPTASPAHPVATAPITNKAGG